MTKVTVGKPKIGGGAYFAPTGTTLPTDASTELAAAFKTLGNVSEDGVVNNTEKEKEEIKNWEGNTVLTADTSFSDKFTFTLIDTLDEDVNKVAYGDSNVSGTIATGLTIKVNAKELNSKVFVFDMVTTDGGMRRIVIPNGKATKSGEITYRSNEAVGYNMEVTALPDANGNTHYEYIKAPA